MDDISQKKRDLFKNYRCANLKYGSMSLEDISKDKRRKFGESETGTNQLLRFERNLVHGNKIVPICEKNRMSENDIEEVEKWLDDICRKAENEW